MKSEKTERTGITHRVVNMWSVHRVKLGDTEEKRKRADSQELQCLRKWNHLLQNWVTEFPTTLIVKTGAFLLSQLCTVCLIITDSEWENSLDRRNFSQMQQTMNSIIYSWKLLCSSWHTQRPLRSYNGPRMSSLTLHRNEMQKTYEIYFVSHLLERTNLSQSSLKARWKGGKKWLRREERGEETEGETKS